MDQLSFFATLDEALKAGLTVILPLLFVTITAFGVAAAQTVIAVREESVQYSVRLIASVSILAMFGTSFLYAVRQVMETALR